MDKKNLTILIGNSDDKLSQKKWAEFCEDVRDICEFRKNEMHFCGTSEGSMPWKNMCIVLTIEYGNYGRLKFDLNELRNRYNQDSIAIIEGETEFIGKGE
jgi:hypothetical protein